MTTFYVMMMGIFGAFDQQILSGKWPTLSDEFQKPKPQSDPIVFTTGQNQEKNFCTLCESNGATVQG